MRRQHRQRFASSTSSNAVEELILLVTLLGKVSNADGLRVNDTSLADKVHLLGAVVSHREASVSVSNVETASLVLSHVGQVLGGLGEIAEVIQSLVAPLQVEVGRVIKAFDLGDSSTSPESSVLVGQNKAHQLVSEVWSVQTDQMAQHVFLVLQLNGLAQSLAKLLRLSLIALLSVVTMDQCESDLVSEIPLLVSDTLQKLRHTDVLSATSAGASEAAVDRLGFLVGHFQASVGFLSGEDHAVQWCILFLNVSESIVDG